MQSVFENPLVMVVIVLVLMYGTMLYSANAMVASHVYKGKQKQLLPYSGWVLLAGLLTFSSNIAQGYLLWSLVHPLTVICYFMLSPPATREILAFLGSKDSMPENELAVAVATRTKKGLNGLYAFSLLTFGLLILV